MRAVITALALSLVTGPALADEVALLIGNDRYDALDRVEAARGIDDAGAALRRAGVEVITLEDADRGAIFDAVRRFEGRIDEADALAVGLVGRFAEVGGETWFLPADAQGASPVDAAASGMPLSLLAELLGEMPGRAVMVLGAPGEVGDIDLPQGVMLAQGEPDAALRYIEDRLAQPGARLTGAEDMSFDGFVSNSLVFIQQDQPAATPTAPANDAEAAYWALTQQRDNADAYAAYLSRYPDGRYATEAQAELDRQSQSPEEQLASAEEALGLGRDARQAVQRDLSVLGYDTRGIDGIFGSGTRGAIRGWQQSRGFEPTGYLTQAQVDALDAQGAERREAQRAQDEALWAEMGQERSEAELQAYLERFPGGFHAEEANRLLTEIRNSQAADDGATERERQIWRATQQENSADGYRRYIAAFPDGEFVGAARAAIAGLEGQVQQPQQPQQQSPIQAPAPQDSANAQEEARLGLTPITRRAVETRLEALGFQPGAVDGTFDQQTRAALRRYQQSAGLPQTGYVNQVTAVRLLADTLRDVLR
ncbi:peptidoglycan-binding domain-containing protein [Palleronia abyssalis]|uniref:Peptidoglycan binding-like domain-containing protein n=1 Tax=Palleronia abyssalis TaxID=1501240 RepID=A0A2R8BTI6_9RHOB|nr:peptidoglycan-binding protein [Palleronia abyssalis]SPJ23396.1 hypothetical protein PAA8504_01206 [Palleronia abyssalis]